MEQVKMSGLGRDDMILIDPSTIMTRLRSHLEHLLQLDNQIFYLFLADQMRSQTLQLGLQMGEHLRRCIKEIDELLGELEPKKADTKLLNVLELTDLANYAEIKRGLIRSWQWIEDREREILRKREIRQTQQAEEVVERHFRPKEVGKEEMVKKW